MPTSSTLTSLAMLKVRIDHGHDYLDYLNPFVHQVLASHKPNPITDTGVRDHIRSDFGIEIPSKVIQVVLKRLAKQLPLRKLDGIYQLTGMISDPGINEAKMIAWRHIASVLKDLQDFSRSTPKPILTIEEADIAIQAFLSQFDVQCLRAYLRGTAIPNADNHQNVHIILVSKYVLALQESDPPKFESFLVVVKGHMLANALLCPDLQSAPKSYRGVTFYFDTPLLVRLLGLEGPVKADAVKELVYLLNKLGGRVAAFEHTRIELENVIKGAAHRVDSMNGRGPVVTEARKSGTTKSDLFLRLEHLNEELESLKVALITTPNYLNAFQIDEVEFSYLLQEDISYANPVAKDYDVNSVRSIYTLRASATPRNIETCKAILVTCNNAFAKAAFKYGERHKQSQEVSTVITDFSLANLAWLKAPMDAPSIPMREVLAFSYAALQPSAPIWDRYLSELDRLEKNGLMTPRDLQLLRSSQLAQEELMNLTLGEESSFSEQTVTEVYHRVSNDIKREERNKLLVEQAAHSSTKADLEHERTERSRTQELLRRRCNRRAHYFALGVCSILVLGLAIVLAVSAGFLVENPILRRLIPAAMIASLLLTLANYICGSSIKGLYRTLHTRSFLFLFERETVSLGLDSGRTE